MALLVASTTVALEVDPRRRWHDVALTGALVCFASILFVERRRPVIRLPAVIAVAVVLLGIGVSASPRESQDVWAYAMYGRIQVVHHANPYRMEPSRFPSDPYLRRVFPAWRHRPALYGPLFMGLAAFVVEMAGSSPTRVRLGFQLLAAFALLGCLALVAGRTNDARAVMFLAWNPLIVVDVVNGAHNDMLVGLSVLAALLLVERRRYVLAGLILAAAVAIKVPALLPAGALALWAWRHHEWRRGAVVGLTAAGAAMLGYLAAGTAALRSVYGAAKLVSPYSIWSLPRTLSVVSLGNPSQGLPAVDHLLLTVAMPCAVTLGVFLAVAQLRRPTPVLATGGAVVGYGLAATYVAPWYFAWALPALALEWRRPMAWVAEVAASILLITYLTTGSAFQPHGVISLGDREATVLFLGWQCLVILAVIVASARDLLQRPPGLGSLARTPSGSPPIELAAGSPVRPE